MFDLTRENAFKVRDVMGRFRPHHLARSKKIRVGRFFDGGYVMVDRFEGVEAAYSLGINDDVSWDVDIAAMGIPLFQYDHTIEKLPQQHKLFQWHRTGIRRNSVQSVDCETLNTLLTRNNHDEASNLLLKCDIEGEEWGVFAELDSSILGKFSQIVVEFHNFHEIGYYDQGELIRRASLNLYATHRVVHVHANNHAPMVVVGGISVPCVFELTFARTDLGDFVASDETFPTPLDFPCQSQTADLYLGPFTFN